MENQDAGVAESGRRKGLKISGEPLETLEVSGNTAASDLAGNGPAPTSLETTSLVVPPAPVAFHDPRISFDFGRDVITICGIHYAMSLFEHLGLGPTDKFYRIIDRHDGVVTIQVLEPESFDIDNRLLAALHAAGRSALGMPGSVDTFKAWLTEAGLGLVLVGSGK